MPRDHIIPKFILRGFAINPTTNKSNQKIMIYDRKTKQIKTEKIADAYAIQDFNSPETEKFLAREYETDVAKIFQRIKEAVEKKQENTNLSNSEYKLLFRFFVIMWRRNNIQLDKMRDLSKEFESYLKAILGENFYKQMLKPEYRNVPIDQEIDQRLNELREPFYDRVIQETNDYDPTVQKTIKYYKPHIIYNKSNIHFIMHNAYATLKYFISGDCVQKDDIPYFFIEPISNTLCFCLALSKDEIDLNKEYYEIPIEIWDEDELIKEHFIKGYITATASSFIVDETNKDYVE